MLPLRSNREPTHETAVRSGGGEAGAPVAVRTEIASMFNDYTSSQRRCKCLFVFFIFLMKSICMNCLDHDRLESLEREMASLKGQVTQAFLPPSNEQDLNRTFPSKKGSPSPPTSARVINPPRVPLPTNNRKSSTDEIPIISTHDGPFSRTLPQVPVSRSKSFLNSSLNSSSSSPTNGSEEANLLRSYKAHLEQVLRKDAPPFSDIRVPNYTSIEDVMKANEVIVNCIIIIIICIFVYIVLLIM